MAGLFYNKDVIRIIDASRDIEVAYINGCFNLAKWQCYINRYLPGRQDIFIDDMHDMINKDYSFEEYFLPVLNQVYNNQKVAELVNTFDKLVKNLNGTVKYKFKRMPEVTIVLYLGLCNGAGWVREIDGQLYMLLGIEKIIELDWCDEDHLAGLIYHELGHVYQMQFGNFDNNYEKKNKYLWQLFIEGIAMVFEQLLINDLDYYHQDRDGWSMWLKQNLHVLKRDFNNDINKMNDSNQRYFGDWVSYQGRADSGYYLGAVFVQFLLKYKSFDELIKMDIDYIRVMWESFVENDNK